jgi:hypothetical protein
LDEERGRRVERIGTANAKIEVPAEKRDTNVTLSRPDLHFRRLQLQSVLASRPGTANPDVTNVMTLTTLKTKGEFHEVQSR